MKIWNNYTGDEDSDLISIDGHWFGGTMEVSEDIDVNIRELRLAGIPQHLLHRRLSPVLSWLNLAVFQIEWADKLVGTEDVFTVMLQFTLPGLYAAVNLYARTDDNDEVIEIGDNGSWCDFYGWRRFVRWLKYEGILLP